MSSSKAMAASTSTATTSKTSTKTAKKMVITLLLSPNLLARFPHAPPTVKASRAKASHSSTPAPAPTPAPALADAAPVAEPSPASNDSNANDTPASNAVAQDAASQAPASSSEANGTNDAKRKGVPGPKPGLKRGLSALGDGLPKIRGKPGPKKKIRLEGETSDATGNKVPLTGPANGASHKLGPKANQGAINAGLRALDRSGKPCRKWERKGFQLRSFTGVTWLVPTWRAPKKMDTGFPGDVKSDTSGSSDAKPVMESSAIASDKSNSGAEADTPKQAPAVASSPAPALEITA